MAKAREKVMQMMEEGVDQAALDAAAAKGFGNALFEYVEHEMSQVVEEFYPPEAIEGSPNNSSVVSRLRSSLDSDVQSAE